MKTNTHEDLERVLMDIIVGLPGVIDTETLILISLPPPEQAAGASPSTDDESPPSAYCRIYGPKIKLDKLVTKLRDVKHVREVYGVLGVDDLIVILEPELSPQEITKTVNEIKILPQLERVETYIAYQTID